MKKLSFLLLISVCCWAALKYDDKQTGDIVVITRTLPTLDLKECETGKELEKGKEGIASSGYRVDNRVVIHCALKLNPVEDAKVKILGTVNGLSNAITKEDKQPGFEPLPAQSRRGEPIKKDLRIGKTDKAWCEGFRRLTPASLTVEVQMTSGFDEIFDLSEKKDQEAAEALLKECFTEYLGKINKDERLRSLELIGIKKN